MVAVSDHSYAVLDYRFSFRTDLEPLAEVVEELLAPHRTKSNGRETRYEASKDHRGAHRLGLFRNGELVQPARSLGPLLDYLMWDVSSGAIASTHYLAVHAAAASWEARGIVMPAHMDAGKTTLVGGLTRSGFAYLSDEAALIDPASGMLHPFARPLWMDPSSIEAVSSIDEAVPLTHRTTMRSNYHLRPERLRPSSVGTACPVRYVIAPGYSPGSATDLVEINRAEGLMLLARNSFNLRNLKGAGVKTLTQAVGEARCYRLTVGDLSSAVRAVRDLVTTQA